MNTNNAGGGEVLQYWGTSEKAPVYLDEAVIRQFAMLPFVRVIIMLLLMVIAVIIILKLMEVKNPLKGKAIVHEIDNLERIRKRDASIVRANKTMIVITKIVEASPFALSKPNIEYWNYNLTRADVRIPGGTRVINPQEFNALIVAGQAFALAIFAVITVFFNAPIGVMLSISTVFLGNTVPMRIVRSTVKVKDMEIVENFADFYLMIHYVLLASAGTPISGIMKSFDKTTNSDEMHRFIDVCIHNIDTYGEYEGTRHIGKHYREIPQVGKLMRLIRQANEGGDVRAELIGFRDELLAAKKHTIRKRMEKVIMQAKMSFNILLPILFQAIASAAAIYLEDLSLTGSFL